MIDMLAAQIPELPPQGRAQTGDGCDCDHDGNAGVGPVCRQRGLFDEILGAGREALLGRTAPPKSGARKPRPKKAAYLARH